MDLQVTARRFEVGGEDFIMAAVEDISPSKRLAVLQRTFFHEALSRAGYIQGYSQYLQANCQDDPEVHQRLAQLGKQLFESIVAQRDLIQAEAGELQIQPAEVSARAVLEEVRLQYGRRFIASDRDIRLGEIWDGPLVTDRRLLQRVLGAMLENALEAAVPGDTVTVACQQRPEGAAFSIHNPQAMSDAVRLQVFQRSFSTSGEAGRGMGTYSMKLLGERYLQGQVDFVSAAGQGTTFRLTIPREIR
jgi:signal transduction histidine kinase